MKTKFFSILFSILITASINAATEWVHDFSFDNIQVWKKGKMRLTIEVKPQDNNLSNYTREKISDYLESRNSILKFADFSNFKNKPIEFTKTKSEVMIEKSGSYQNSKNKTINYKERHILYPKMSIVSMISSDKILTKEDIKDFNEKLSYVVEQSRDK